MIAVAAIVLGYIGLIVGFGWLGVAAVAVHIGIMVLGTAASRWLNR